MRRLIPFFAAMLLCDRMVAAQLTQPEPAHPPKYLHIVEEEVRPDKLPVHHRTGAPCAEEPQSAGTHTPYIAASSLAGKAELLRIVLYQSLSEFERQSGMTRGHDPCPSGDGNSINGMHSMLARRRDDLGFRSDFNFGDYRFFALHILRYRVAHPMDAAESVKILNSAREAAGSNVHIVVYEVMAGDTEGTLLSIVPRKSLAELEQSEGRMLRAVGENGWKRLGQLSDSAGFTLENGLFAFEPRYSDVPESIAACDPSFWKVKKGKTEAFRSNYANRAPRPMTGVSSGDRRAGENRP